MAAIYAELVDRVAVRTSQMLRQAGIDHLLVKGPAIARWLYRPDEVRSYGDADFLIRAQDWDRTVELLRSQGFEDAMASMAHPRMESFASHPWTSQNGDVDLHATFKGLTADTETVWAVLAEERETLQLADGTVEVPGPAARLMHIALHAAQHLGGKAITDLELAVARMDDALWLRAVDLAERTGGSAAFLSGLRSVAAGRELAERLELPDVRSVHSLLHAQAIPLAEALHQLSTVSGSRAKLALVAREIVPTAEFMRWWSPIAHRGRLGLAAAYLWRPVYLASRLPRAAIALWRARRRAGAGS
jgi:hypothetical protein